MKQNDDFQKNYSKFWRNQYEKILELLGSLNPLRNRYSIHNEILVEDIVSQDVQKKKNEIQRPRCSIEARINTKKLVKSGDQMIPHSGKLDCTRPWSENLRGKLLTRHYVDLDDFGSMNIGRKPKPEMADQPTQILNSDVSPNYRKVQIRDESPDYKEYQYNGQRNTPEDT